MSEVNREKSADRRARFFKNLDQALVAATPTGKRANSQDDLSAVKDVAPYIPETLSKEQCLASFKKFMEAQNTELYEIPSINDLPEKLTEVLSHKNYGQEIMIGENALLQNLNWSETGKLKIKINKGEKVSDLNLAMATAFAAAAETGTLLFSSGVDNPTPLNYLPTCHIAVLDADTICQTYEQAYQYGEQLSAESEQKAGEGQPSAFPKRSLNFISGPSRTADIEQTLTLGAHGPLELIVMIYNV